VMYQSGYRQKAGILFLCFNEAPENIPDRDTGL